MKTINFCSEQLLKENDAVLNSAVSKLYQVFLKSSGIGNRVLFEFEECYNNAQLKKPLDAISSLDLQKYIPTAVTSWGTLEDFKYFLPRILELLSLHNNKNEGLTEIDCMTICTKLVYSKWKDWELDEQEALEEYFFALFKQVASSPVYLYHTGDSESEIWRHYTYSTCLFDWLFDFCLTELDIEKFIAYWANAIDLTSVLHLAQSVLCYCIFQNNRVCIKHDRVMVTCEYLSHIEEWLLSEKVNEMLDNGFELTDDPTALLLLIEANNILRG